MGLRTSCGIATLGSILFFLLAHLSCAIAEEKARLSGTYMCQSGCRVTDAYPTVEIDGDVATCWNELGGIFHGEALSANAISCFHKIGRLSSDGGILRWDDGVVWRRVSQPAQ